MIRLAAVLLGLMALAGLAAWFADHPGLLALDWGGWRIEMPVGIAMLVLVVGVAIALVLFRLLRWLLRGPGAVRAAALDRRHRKGFEALSRGLVAVAAGDGIEARRLAKRTASLLDDPALTLLLSAQAAQLNGEDAVAKAQFQAMCLRPETEFLGLRGLLAHARREGDDDHALSLAYRAYDLKPDAPWLLRELFDLEAAREDWQAAGKILRQAEKRKAIPASELVNDQAVLTYLKALQADADGASQQARDLALEAHKKRPDLVPALVLALRNMMAGGQTRKARKMLLTAWRGEPHPQLAELLYDFDAGETATAKLSRLKKTVGAAPVERDAKLMLARAALGAGDQKYALELLRFQGGGLADREICSLTAAVYEELLNDDEESRRWLKLAAVAPAPPQWRCADCGEQHPDWQSHCRACGAFASLIWAREALQVEVLAPDEPDDLTHDREVDLAGDENEISVADKDTQDVVSEKPPARPRPPEVDISVLQAESANTEPVIRDYAPDHPLSRPKR